MLDTGETETLLEVKNIEVIYNHVILVLKGVSLSVPKGGIIALLGGIAQWTARGIDVPARLAAGTGRSALVYERLGHGRSDPLPDPRGPRYLHDEAWRSLPDVLDAADIGRALLIGHSDGGSIALLFAARFPDRAAGVVAEAAHMIVEDVTLAGIRAARTAFDAPDGRLRSALRRHHGGNRVRIL